ncbi:MAG TPA: ferritin family protein [Candidatus Omnitrophota bacterium]|nr:ferritin family protein [Candidatus Omnitrophota bacterium]
MANIFNAAEIIDMGIEKERKRRDFYARVSEEFSEKDLKKLFGDLSNWEEEHIKKFTEIRNSVADEEITESYQGEFTAYIRSLVDDKLYSQVTSSSFAKNIKTPLDAIHWGMGFEKDAILFFNELIEYMPPQNKEKIRILINEEKKHIIYLSQLREKYIK